MWFGISGSWRYEFQELTRDVETAVESILGIDCGIITGGALGVDYIATDAIVDFLGENILGRLRLYLPIPLKKYLEYLEKRVLEGKVTKRRVDALSEQLRGIQETCPDCIRDNWGFEEVNKKSYYSRIDKIVGDIDGLYAFQVNDSEGVQYSVNLAREQEKSVFLKSYRI
ncbi:MAG: hypothetical protein KKC19_03300 [Nanoarchaeota archaeon]|nr:hypothetical protein [Nanoarchaeota archaeon]